MKKLIIVRRGVHLPVKGGRLTLEGVADMTNLGNYIAETYPGSDEKILIISTHDQTGEESIKIITDILTSKGITHTSELYAVDHFERGLLEDTQSFLDLTKKANDQGYTTVVCILRVSGYGNLTIAIAEEYAKRMSAHIPGYIDALRNTDKKVAYVLNTEPYSISAVTISTKKQD